MVIPVGIDASQYETQEPGDHTGLLPRKTIAAMGRFVKEKRFDLLLTAFAKVASRHECSLIVVGDGPLRSELEELTRDLGLSDRVTMPGFVHEPWRILKDAYMFVVSSETEGMGRVIVEAMACGVPVVSFDCPHGPRAVIRDGIDGILAPPLDVEALAGAMERLLTDESERNRLARRALEARDRFRLENVMNMWEEAVFAACAKHSKP
jgi:glycosyltransferase involved in cell wall biosynthesis